MNNNEYYKNTLVLLLGKFCTQFISFLLLPIFTHFLISADYGYVDLLQTYISLFVPVIILRIDSAVFRYLIDERKRKKDIIETITNSILIILISSVLIIITCFILGRIFHIKYLLLLTINIIILIISSVVLQIARGLGDNLNYSISSIITGIINLIVNLILILNFNFNASSILISSILSNIICIIYLIIKLKIYKFISFKKINKIKLVKMLKYSFPMIPNSLSWWIINVSDRSIISFVLGISFNGIYTVSCKFSNILNNIFNVFNMSWTETTSLHINDKESNKFFSQMINKIFYLFSCIGLIIVAILPLFYNILIGKEYIESYKYIPILILSGNMNVLSWLLGGIYIAKKETKLVAKTTIYSAIINLLTHIILVKYIGLYAACFSTFISYIILVIYRYLDVQKYVKINFNFKSYFIIFIMYIVIFLIYYLFKNALIRILGIILVFIFSIFINREMLKEIIIIIKNKVGVKNG